MEKNFTQFYKQLPNEIQQMINGLGISSFEDLFGLAVIMGVDLEKLEKSMKDGSLISGKVQFEDLLSEENKLNSFFNGHGEDDPFAFPANCYIEDAEEKELHLRVKLLYSNIPIWREIKVPSNITLESFAFIINSVMGWDNRHLHMFETKDAQYKNTVCLKQDREMGFDCRRKTVLDSNVFPLSHFFKEKKDRIKYEYDFGDSWEHEIWLKGIREYGSEETTYFKVVKGVGACPPEDCGGVWGYAELLELKNKPRKTKEEKEQLEWYGIDKNYDPHYFDIDYAQDELEDVIEMLIQQVRLKML